MRRNSGSLIGFIMHASDGELGRVEDFYFDDQSWQILYLVVKTGNWLSGRKVLIEPAVLIKGESYLGTFPVSLTMEQIRTSPDIDTHKPVYRQKEIELHKRYPSQSYLETGFYEGGIRGIVVQPRVGRLKTVEVNEHPGGDLHLRSTHAIKGYHIETTDGQAGHLKDFIIDDDSWHILFLVIEVHGLPTRKNVIIEPKHIKSIQWDNSVVSVDLASDVLENSPEYVIP